MQEKYPGYPSRICPMRGCGTEQQQQEQRFFSFLLIHRNCKN